MATKPVSPDWLGKIRGHVSQANEHFARDKQEWQENRNVILSDDQIKYRDWDAAKILHTTLGGVYRPIQITDLPVFHRNMQKVREQWEKVGGKKKADKLQGITPRQVIDMASGVPLNYKHPVRYKSDIDKARREITSAVPVSANKDTIRFLTNASKEYGATRHTVIVQLLEYEDAVSKVTTLPPDDKRSVFRIANAMRHGRVKFDCDCGRHRYFFRYVATQGGWAAGRQEVGFPKIRNPYVLGCACKHVLRVLTELESSTFVAKFLERHLNSIRDRSAKTQLKQKEAEEALLRKKTVSKIKTSLQRKEEADRRKQLRAEKTVKKNQKPPKKNVPQGNASGKRKVPKKKPAAMELTEAQREMLRMLEKEGMTVEMLKALLKVK